jgi:hypothetical protein
MLALLSTSSAQQPLSSTPKVGAVARENLSGLLELPRQILSVQPTRDDISVRSVVFSVSGSDGLFHGETDGIRINGVVPKSSQLNLKQVGKNQFELPALKIEYSSQVFGGPLYLTLKVWFNEVSTEDVFFYQDRQDRYALLTYCTDEAEDPAMVNARWGANRAKTWKEFKEKLAAPLVLNLKPQPLRENMGYPMVNNFLGNPGMFDFRRPTEADLKAVKELMRERGEGHLFAITARDFDHASVFASVKDGTEFYGRRIYQIARIDGTWRIVSVETVENSF